MGQRRIDRKADKAIRAAVKEEFDYCRDHLIYFASEYCYFEDKDAPEVVVPFHPWPEQVEALRSIRNNRLNLFLKARQIGITWVALIYCVHDLVFHPGHTVIAMSKTENDAFELVRRCGVILDRMKELLSGGGVTFTVKKGEIEIQKKGTNARSSFKAFAATRSAGRSFTANILMIDEWAFQEWAREIWTAAYPTVNRPTGGKVIGISTIKRGTLFEELWTQDNGFCKTFISVFADPRRDGTWFASVQRDLGELWKQEYPRTAEEALANIGGVMFPTFDVAKHVCQPFEIPRDWKIYSTMDYGFDMLAHYKIAVDSRRNCYVFHEIYESGAIVSEASEKIREADRREGAPWLVPGVRLAPPDLFAKELTSGKSQAQGFAEEGIRLVRSHNDRETGWLYVKELLRERPQEDGTTAPRLHIFSTCPNLIRTMQQAMVDEKKPNDMKTEPHEVTHAPDALRYFAVWWIRPAEDLPKAPQTGKWTEDMWEDYAGATPEEREYLKEKWRDRQ